MIARLVLSVGLVAAVATAMPVVSPGMAASPAAGQDGDDRGGSPPLDLAATVPGPDDLPDEGYAVSLNASRTLSGYADLLNTYHGGGRAELGDRVEALEEAGWRQWYEYRLSLPSDDDPDLFARSIYFELVEYEDEAGAEAGYELMTDADAAVGLEESRGGRTVGDQSVLTRGAWTTSTTNTRYQELDLVFQTGAVVARVAIYDYRNDSPPASEAVALGEDLAERIEAVGEDGGPRLGPAVQRIDADGQAIYNDWYRRLDDVTRRDYSETGDAYESADEWFEDTSQTDVYTVYQEFPGEDEDDPLYSYLVTLRGFEDEDTAAAFAEDESQAFVEDPANSYSNVVFVEDAEPFGDLSAAVSFDYTRLDGTVASGFQYYVQSGDRVVSVEIDGVPGVPLAAVETLVETQVTCLEDDGCSDWTPLPDEIGGPGAPEPDTGNDGDEGPAPADEEAVEVTIGEVDDSGVRGTAILTPDGDETEAELELRGIEEGMVAVVQEGTCDDLDPDPVAGPEEVDEDGAATLAIPLALDELLDDAHAIAVYESERDLGDDPLACGEIES